MLCRNNRSHLVQKRTDSLDAEADRTHKNSLKIMPFTKSCLNLHSDCWQGFAHVLTPTPCPLATARSPHRLQQRAVRYGWNVWSPDLLGGQQLPRGFTVATHVGSLLHTHSVSAHTAHVHIYKYCCIPFRANKHFLCEPVDQFYILHWVFLFWRLWDEFSFFLKPFLD